ncbi:PREDICTED: L10-interacting MYB domain-containing protein-like isoform X3 [Tarenaya hassleriana]|nr:PREDICTED: L10-interacting MYB domain-containing protein-like isoform X3 [Tarenaya hassleriana]
MDGEISQQPRQERSRTRWTPILDKVFADLVVKQIQLGNRQNNVFDKKTWSHICQEFNEQTHLNFNNNQLRKHLDVLRQRYNALKPSHLQNEFVIEDNCIGFGLWEDLGVHPRAEPIKVTDCSIYEQLCAIFDDNYLDGRYAQSSHFEGLEATLANQTFHEGTTQSLKLITPKAGKGNVSLLEKDSRNFTERKRKRKPETSPALARSPIETMGRAMLDMVDALRSRMADATKTDDKFSIGNCISALDEMENVDEGIYFSALDLFESPCLREIFLSLKGNKIRLIWLQGKCRTPSLPTPC